MAGPVDNEFLIQAATYLGATAIAVPIFKRLKLGTILGFLAAGIVLGEHGFGLLRAEEGVFHVAELGVVLFLFVIGLELSLARLWNLRHGIFGLGFAQMLTTGLLIGGGLMALGVLSVSAALIAGFALACSSTAFALSLLEERGELNSPYGTKAFSILLFQDLAVIPLLAIIPFAAAGVIGGGGMGDEGIDMMAFAKVAGVIIGLILIARFVLNHILNLIAVSGSREAFAAAALFVVAATALAVSSVGLSMALGAFLAGVMLAESSFRHQIEADIEPFRELLLGLFFIGVGMQLDLQVILENWLLVCGAALALVLFKGGMIYLIAKLFRSNTQDALRTGAVLSQGGEFAFVVFSLGAAEGLFGNQLVTIMSAIVTLSMMTTPLVMIAANRVRGDGGLQETPEALSKMEGQVLVIGFGRMGQIISQVLHSSGVQITTIDNNPQRIENARRFGNKVYYGDGFNLNLLLTAGAGSADAVIFVVDDKRGQLRSIIAGLRAHCPNIKIIVRAHDRLHEIELLDADADHIVRETLESSLDMAARTLAGLGKSDGFISDVTQEFRLRDREILLQQKAGDIYAGREKTREPFKATHQDDDDR